ncbi:MAG: sugar ABC transporter permease [Trueperaceae bacterium]|nr:MAG: sugar ABC transporter permease [Trueperaceae bacterium]
MSTKPAEAQVQGESIFQRIVSLLELDVRQLAMVGALVLIWIGFDIVTDGIFLSPRNLWNLSVQMSVVGVMATGMVLVIVARHIDLSVGSLMGFAAIIMAVLQVQVFPIGASWNWWVTLLIGLAVGALIGALHGFIIAYLEVPAFIVTLGGLLAWRGANWLTTTGRTISPLDVNFQMIGGGIDGAIGATASWVVGVIAVVLIVFANLSARQRRQKYGFNVKPWWAELLILALTAAVILYAISYLNQYYRPRTEIPRGIALPVLILLAVTVFMAALVRYTKFGRYVFAMGGNPEAARLSGVNTRRVTLQIFVIMGVLCAIAGAISSARLNAGANSLGTLKELEVIAAAVIGGTSLAGGMGTISGAILGTVLISSLASGMVLIGWSTSLQQVVQGIVLVLAVWLDVFYQKRRVD